MMQPARTIILCAAIVVVAALIFYFESEKPRRIAPKGVEIKTPITATKKQEKAKQYPPAKEIVNPAGFINGDHLSIAELVGKKVILVDFWTYSCINCQRTIPYLNAWYEKYKDKGLVIVGVHTPEFEFEKKYDNVLAAVKKFNIQYPVVLDNDYSTWNAYGNRYWPREYLIDIDGFIVHDHIGEGDYEATEKRIQQALEERMTALGMGEPIELGISKPAGAQPVDSSKVKSPEVYLGAARNLYLGNGTSGVRGMQGLSEPTQIKSNVLYLSGDWDFQDEFAENKSGSAKIIFRYQAKNVYFVAGSENGAKIRILKDGTRVGEPEVREHKLYTIIQDPDYGEHTLEIIIESPGLRGFTLTFG